MNPRQEIRSLTTNPLGYGRIDLEGVNTYTGKLTIDDKDTNRTDAGPRVRLQGELPNSNIEILNGSTLHGDTTGGVTPLIHFSDGNAILVSGYPEILNDPDPPTPAVTSIFDSELIKWDLTGLTASAGTTVTLVDYSSDGEFILGPTPLADVLTLDSTTAGWTLSDDGALVTAVVPSAVLPGDANSSGFVDDDDLAVLLSNWEQDPGTITTWELGDFTGNTDVDDDDLAVLLGNWTGPPPGGAAVPEPATLALLGLGGLSVLRRRRK